VACEKICAALSESTGQLNNLRDLLKVSNHANENLCDLVAVDIPEGDRQAACLDPYFAASR
jgi:hypothetical protein